MPSPACGLTPSYRTMASVPMFEEMIVSGAWWDFVDAIAAHQLGDVLRTDPRRMSKLMRRWSRDAHMWKRRAAILCQIRFKRDTDLTLLYDCIEPNLSRQAVLHSQGDWLGAASVRVGRSARGQAIRQGEQIALSGFSVTGSAEEHLVGSGLYGSRLSALGSRAA